MSFCRRCNATSAGAHKANAKALEPYGKRLIDEGVIDQDGLQKIKDEVAREVNEAADMALALRRQLEAVFPLPRLVADVEQLSADGTRKFLFRLHDNEAIETVAIPEGDRVTLCI